MSKRTIWLKGSEIRKMTSKQIANYEFNTRITDSDEPSDHELLKQLVTKVSGIETRLNNIETRLDNLVKKNNLIE